MSVVLCSLSAYLSCASFENICSLICGAAKISNMHTATRLHAGFDFEDIDAMEVSEGFSVVL